MQDKICPIWYTISYRLWASLTSLRGPYLCAACPVLHWGKDPVKSTFFAAFPFPHCKTGHKHINRNPRKAPVKPLNLMFICRVPSLGSELFHVGWRYWWPHGAPHYAYSWNEPNFFWKGRECPCLYPITRSKFNPSQDYKYKEEERRWKKKEEEEEEERRSLRCYYLDLQKASEPFLHYSIPFVGVNGFLQNTSLPSSPFPFPPNGFCKAWNRPYNIQRTDPPH